MTSTFLKVKGLQVAYGGIQAVKGIDFEVQEGELVSLIGSNGAGKTSTMKAITGTLPIHAGDIEFGSPTADAWEIDDDLVLRAANSERKRNPPPEIVESKRHDKKATSARKSRR